MLKVTCLGATQTVTGSNFLVETPSGSHYLVDCGLYQGPKKLERRNWADWDFDPAAIKALLLTHAHIDHCGRIPKLVKDGFQGKIVTTQATAELCDIMLQDAAHIQEMQAEWESRKKKRQGKPPVDPLYTTEDAQAAMPFFHTVQRNEFIDLEPGLRIRLHNAGHILGSSILEIRARHNGEDMRVIFSGDLGQRDQLLVQDPEQIQNADHLFIESTYGDRNHRSLNESKEELLQAIDLSVRAGEKVLIPAFAVERTQEIITILGEFHRQGRLPDIPIFLDSPLAIKATQIFQSHVQDFDAETRALAEQGIDPFTLPGLKLTASTQQSMAINEYKGPAIIIAGNGMGTAGRILHHFKHNLWREGCSVVIVGFQAAGSTGRRLVNRARQIKVMGETISVRARVFTIGGFSAHADQGDLLNWIGQIKTQPALYLVHGEESAITTLARIIRKDYGLDVHIPTWKERILLKPRQVEEEPAFVEKEDRDLSTTAINTLVDVEHVIKDLKKRLASAEGMSNLDDEDIDRLQGMVQDLQSMLEQ